MAAGVLRETSRGSQNATLLRDEPLDEPTMLITSFVKRTFIPNHVRLKSPAGQTHYQAILKHIFTPEAVEALFAPYGTAAKTRLKAIPDWPYLDHVRLCDLNPEHVRQLTFSASFHGYSPQTVKHIRNVVGAIVTYAKKERVFHGENPTSAVQLPRLTRRQQHALSIDQAKTLVKGLGYPEREIALLTLSTGITFWEVCALQWKDINLSNKAIRVEGESIPGQSMLVRKQWTPEGELRTSGVRKRILPLPKPMVRVLAKLQQERSDCELISYLVSGCAGHPSEPARIRLAGLKSIGQQLSMPWLSWEVLRRAHTSMLVELRNRLSEELVLGIGS